MGLEMMFENEEDVCRRAEKVDSLVESLRMTYKDSVWEELRKYEFNFVISDPRLPENPVVYASEGFCEMSGYSREEVVGRNCRFLQGPDTDRRTVLEVRDAIREERSAQVRILNYTNEGKPFWNLFHLAPVFSKADGTVIHYVGVQTPISCQLVTSLQEIESAVIRQEGGAEPSLNFPFAVCELSHHYKNGESVVGLSDPGYPKADADFRRLNGFSNGFRISNVNSNRVVLPSSGKDMDVNEMGVGQAVTTHARGREMGVSDAYKPQELESLKASTATRTIVSQLIEYSKGKGGVLHRKYSECTAAGVTGKCDLGSWPICSTPPVKKGGAVCLRVLFFNHHGLIAPIVHASDLFLDLTGYAREEVLGRSCRFLQGPGTDRAAIAQIRESISLETRCSVRLLNYRKDKRPFWNLLHLSPVRSSGGEVAFFVGVQLQVSAADDEEETDGMSAHMRQLGAVGAVRVAVRSLQGTGLHRIIKKFQC